MGMAARAGLMGCASLRAKKKGDDRVVIALSVRGAGYCRLAGPEAGAGLPVDESPPDSSGDSMSGVPDVSGMLADEEAVSSSGLTSEGGASCCCSIGFGGSGGTLGR